MYKKVFHYTKKLILKIKYKSRVGLINFFMSIFDLKLDA